MKEKDFRDTIAWSLVGVTAGAILCAAVVGVVVVLLMCFAGCKPGSTSKPCLSPITFDVEADYIFWKMPITEMPPAEICAERGHVWSSTGSVTLLYAPPRLVDLEDRTVRIYQNPNTTTYVCERCGKIITDPVQAVPDTVVIWRKGEEVER